MDATDYRPPNLLRLEMGLGPRIMAPINKTSSCGNKDRNAWQTDNPDVSLSPDLTGADLHDAELALANLSGANLTVVMLEGAKLSFENVSSTEYSLNGFYRASEFNFRARAERESLRRRPCFPQ